MFDAWNILEKVCGATTDNGSNIVKGVGLLGLDTFHVLQHTLQLSIKRGLNVTAV